MPNQPENPTKPAAGSPAPGDLKSMHRDVPMDCDTCCCEAEPRWADLGRELGIDTDERYDARRSRD